MYINSILPNNINTRNTAFGSRIHGIELPKATKKEIDFLSGELSRVIGHETHNSEIPIGNSKAVYSKWSNDFSINIDDNTDLSLMTYKGKIHSIYAHLIEKINGKKIVKSFSLYNGCKQAQNPVPSIQYREVDTANILKGYHSEYKPGDNISAKDSKKISNLLNIIFEKLGLK